MRDVLGLTRSDYFEKGFLVDESREPYLIYIPENDYFIVDGYYSRSGIVYLLRTYRDYPATIHFIADMME